MAHFAFDIICDVPHSSLQSTSKWPVAKKSPAREASSSVLTRGNEWSLSRWPEKNPREKKIATLFPPDGPNRARLRHAAVTCEAADVFPLISSEGILVPERLSSLSHSLRQRGPPLSVTVRNYKGESAFKDWRKKILVPP